jgi:hypothetical protein
MLFLDDADYVKLRALAHGGTARRCSIELFLAKVFGREAEYEAQAAADAEADGRKRRKQPTLDPSRHRWAPGGVRGQQERLLTGVFWMLHRLAGRQGGDCAKCGGSLGWHCKCCCVLGIGCSHGCGQWCCHAVMRCSHASGFGLLQRCMLAFFSWLCDWPIDANHCAVLLLLLLQGAPCEVCCC